MRKTALNITFRKDTAGFTLVELLVVIAIVAILAAIVVLIINPLELTRRSRDAARLSDMANLQQAINVAVQESTQSGQNILCNGAAYPCAGNSATDTRAANGTGWVLVDLSSAKSVSVPTLPVDPLNTTGVTGNHYLYCADKPAGSNEGWEIVTLLESTQQSPKMGTDGGTDSAKYEVGSLLTLLGVSTGCTY